MALPKINHAEKALKIIWQAIISGELRPNQRLIEADIARNLGMSRTPVRDALRRLEIQGYLSKLPHGGLIITDPRSNQLQNMYEVREALETAAIRLACQRGTEEQIERAAKYHDLSWELFNNRDIDKWIELNSAFHLELAAACGNEQMLALIQTLSGRFFRRQIFNVFTPRDCRTLLQQEKRILDALRRRNVRLAERAVRQHIRMSLKVALERL